MHTKTLISDINVRTRIWIISFGCVLGVCIGVLVFTLTSSLTDRELLNPGSRLHDLDTEVERETSHTHPFLNAIDPTSLLTKVLGSGLGSDDLLDRFDPSELLTLSSLINKAQQSDYSIPLKTLRKLLIGDLARIDSVATLGIIEHLPPPEWNELIYIVCSNWSIRDLSGALRAIEDLHLPIRETAISVVLDTRRDQLPWIEEYLDARTLTPRLKNLIAEEELREKISTHPLDVWNEITKDTLSNVEQKGILLELLSVWVFQEGKLVFDHIYESRHVISPSLVRDLVFAIVQHQASDTFQYAISLPQNRRNWLLPIVLEKWSEQDPQVAFQALAEVKNFDGSLIRFIILRNWAQLDPGSLLAKLESLPRSQRGNAATEAISQLTRINPSATKTVLSNWSGILGVDVNKLRRAFVREWAKQSPVEAFVWLRDNVQDGGEEHAYMLDNILSSLARDEPERAFEIAVSQHSSSYYMQSGFFFGSLISTICIRGHIDLVISNFERVPVSAQISTVNTLATHLIGASRWEDAIQLIEAMSGDLLNWYFDRLGYHGAATNVSELINQLNSLPSDEARSIVVQRVLSSHDLSGGILTDNQLKQLRSLSDQLPKSEYSLSD